MAAVGTGVTIGGRTVRVLQVRRTKEGGWQVQRGLVVPFAEAEPSESARASEARAAVNTAQAKGAALVGVSGRDLIMRYTHVPPVPDWRLEMLMNFEIQEVSEQSGGDVSAAYAQLEVDDASSGDNVVLVALAKNTFLKPRLQALKDSGLDVVGASPKAVALYNCYRENGRVRPDETIVLVNVGHENTDVAVVRKGVLLFARNVAGGGKLLTDAIQQNVRVDFATAEKLKVTKGNMTPRGQAKYRDSMEEKVANAMMQAGGHFVSAVNSSVLFAKAQTKVPECQVSRVVLTGGGSRLKGLAEYLESNLNLPVEVFDPMDSVDLSALTPDAQAALKQDQGGMTIALGLAQMAADETSLRVAILPEADRKARRFKERTLFSIAAAVLLLAAVIVSWTLKSSAYAEAKRESADLTTRRDAFDTNLRDFKKASDYVVSVTDRKAELREKVALGPAVQLCTDAVQTVINRGEGYPEVFVSKLTAKMVDHTEQDDKGVDHSRRVPEISVEMAILEGQRPIQDVDSNFKLELRRELQKVGGFQYEDRALNTEKRTFSFRVLQTAYPDKVEQERKAGEGN